MTFKEVVEYNFIDTKTVDINLYSVFTVLIILILGIFTIRVIKKIFNKQVTNNKIDYGTSNSVFHIIKYIIWVILIALTLETLGIKVTILVAGSAALLVGIGFGLQDIFKDLISGFFLLFEGNLKVNDVVQIENNVVGRVVSIGLRTSKIKTRDNISMIIPNSSFINDNVINWSHIEEQTRFNVEVGVAYGSDVELVSEILIDVAKANKDISSSPEPFIRFNNFGNSSLDFQIFFWSKQSFRVENIKSQLRFEIDKKFRENKITIPFPQQDVHVKKDLF
ncbi:MAG: mechanosensitive ion channel [Bacteroidota bacterium]|nr:mechanosensitive ion channel [Bacteroidota bacterium]